MGCQPENPDGLPPHISALDSLIVLPAGDYPSNYINLTRELAFNDSLLFDKITAAVADRYGNVYIAGKSWNRRQIYIFDRNGTKTDSLGTHGTDFGQFLELSSLQLENSNLYIFDHQLGRVTTYNTELREITDTTGFKFDGDHLPGDWQGFHSFPIAVLNDNSYLAAFQRSREPEYEPEGEIRYYKTDASGGLMPGKFHSQPDIKYLVGDYAGRPAHFALSHPERPLLEISENGRIYSAFTDEFLIHVLDKNGEKKYSYYHPAKKLDLDPKEIIHPRFSHNDQLLRVRESAEYPDKWPALFSLLSDDENRIWVSAITENRAELKWYVIDDDTGEIEFTFQWPFDKPISFVRGGSVYTIEKDDMGFEQVVRYRMNVLP